MRVFSILLIVVLGMYCYKSQAQTGKLSTVEGRITDSLEAPVEFCTVIIKNRTAGTERTVLTDINGFFRFQNLTRGNYNIILLMAGYKQNTVKVDLNDPLSDTMDIGKIVLVREVKSLEKVTVVGRKPLVTQEIDRIIYNIKDDNDSKTSNMLDMMRKVPFVSLTIDDQVLFKGKANFKVLLDGRNTGILSARNLRDVLKGIPASTILQVEVITALPARYEGEGLDGIINIITNKKLKDGYNASVNANYSRLFSGLSGSLNLKKGDFNAAVFGGSSREVLPVSPFNHSFSQFNPARYDLFRTGERKLRDDQVYFNSFLSYEPDSLNLLTASFGYINSHRRQDNWQHTEMYDDAEALSQSYNLNTAVINNENNLDAGFNYQKGFKRNKRQFFTFSYRYLGSRPEFENLNTVNDKFNYIGNDYRQRNMVRSDEQGLQLDYIHPVKKITIEAGSKYFHRNKLSNYYQESYSTSLGRYVTDNDASDAFQYKQNIFSFYNSYTLREKNWIARAGFRLETTSLSATFLAGRDNFTWDYVNLLPSIIFLYRFKNATSSTLSYSQKVLRPGISLLNPFVDKSDPRFVRSGNADLLPVRTHSIKLSYTRIKASNISVDINYSFSGNTIQSITTTLPSDSVVYITYQNIGRYDNLGTNLNLTFPLSKNISLTANGNLNYAWIRGNIDGRRERNQGVEGFLYSYLSFRAKNYWRFSLNGGFYGPVRNLQGNSNGYLYSSVSVSKQIFKQQGAVSLSVSNPFQKYRTVKDIVKAPGFYQETIYKNYFRNINVSFYYRFGKLKEEIKKNKRNIDTDDKVVPVEKKQL